MPTLTQGRLWVLSSSLLVSIGVLGLSITLLHVETPSSFRQHNYMNSGSPNGPPQPQPPQPTYLSRRDYDDDADEFHASEILAIVSSALNLLLGAALIIAPAVVKKKTIFSAVAVEAPCIYVLSFMWLATGAYAEHLVNWMPGYPQILDAPECTRHKILEGFAFLNWIQLMLYANTLMTVATICHVRKRSVWLLPVSELPTLGAPALTFDSGADTTFESPFLVKTDESEPILGASRPNVSSRAPSHFRSRLTFPEFPNHRRRTLSAVPSALSTSESVESLAPSMSIQDDANSLNLVNHLGPSTYYRVGEPPTYSGPGAGYENEAM